MSRNSKLMSNALKEEIAKELTQRELLTYNKKRINEE